MNILVTGAQGFIGKNLVATLEAVRDEKDETRGLPEDLQLLLWDVDTKPDLWDVYCSQADFVVHLAGINRPKEEEEFMTGNAGFTAQLLENLEKHESSATVLMTSSIQAELDNSYGRSKKAAEDLVLAYGRRPGRSGLVYRMPNVFGKWCRPQYNSAVATFCDQAARNLPLTVNDPATEMRLVYVDDVVDEIICAMKGNPRREGDACVIRPEYRCTLGRIADLLRSFQESRETLSPPNLEDDFTRKLYAAYLSYLPSEQFAYPLTMHQDVRGSFTEMLRTPDRGQVSVNVSKPRVVKGNHWHHTKNEKFLVVSGTGVIRFRKIGESRVQEYFVNGETLRVVDIPTGYTHHIENLGDDDLVTVMWASESFDPKRPDTYFEEV